MKKTYITPQAIAHNVIFANSILTLSVGAETINDANKTEFTLLNKQEPAHIDIWGDVWE